VAGRSAPERLGAVRDGLVRRDWPRPDGSWRDSMYYSILILMITDSPTGPTRFLCLLARSFSGGAPGRRGA
jgi:hypothetical protein